MDELAPRRRGRHAADPIIIEALASGAGHAEAARAANVSVRTVTRRLADPSFRGQLDEIHARSLEGIAADLAASAAPAIKALVELLSADQPPTVRATAARALLSANLQYRNAAEAPESAQPEDAEDLESLRQSGLEIVDEIVRRRATQFQESQNAGRAPPDPPPCINDHAGGECDHCAAWQATAHEIVLEHSIGPEGRLTDTGSQVREQVWPLRPATIQLLNAAYDRRSNRSES